MIISGDEFQALEKAKSLNEGKSILHKSQIVISRSSRDVVDSENNIIVCCGYIRKDSDFVFEYIKLGQEYLLSRYTDNYQNVPLNEFRDLKNPSYTVVAYDLLEFYHNKIIDIKDVPTVWEFSDYFLNKDYKKIINKYSFILSGNDENYFWVTNDAIDSCLKILSGDNNMHAYKLKKLKYMAFTLGFDELFRMKDIIQRLVMSRRNGENYYKSLRILEELAM